MLISESLQDGGWTGMIVCISPTDYDINETVSSALRLYQYFIFVTILFCPILCTIEFAHQIFQVNTLRYANRAKELTKPPVPKYLLKEAQAQNRKRKFAGLIPPTPAHWKRPILKMNNTIETPTPSKRLKMLNGSKIDTAHSFTFATPNETPSEFNKKPILNGHSSSKNMLTSAVKRNMDKLLQDIEEEGVETNILEEETLKLRTPDTLGSEVSGISPYVESSKTVTTIRKEVLTNMASPNLRKELLKNNVTLNKPTNPNNVTMIDVTNLSPMIRRITDQVCQQFEQRCR